MTRHATITGVGSVLPPRLVPNTWFEDKVETSDAWIRERTGIVARHFVDDGVVSHVWYPVFPPDRSASEVVEWLSSAA